MSTNEFFDFGRQLHSILAGFLQQGRFESAPAPGEESRFTWGRTLDGEGLPELFAGELAPRRHIRGVHPPAGIDHMKLKTVDVFRIPDRGEFVVPFEGFFRIIRSEADSSDFASATVYVNFVELKLFGTHDELGDMMVDLNPRVVSAGNTFPSRVPGVEACAINVAARFHVQNADLILFNKAPIQLQNPDVKGIPTIGEGGKAGVFSLPLYRWEDPNGKLFGYVEELNYQVLNYATREEVSRYRRARSLSEFRQLSGMA